MYKIIVSDLDGTLLTPEHIVADYTKTVLKELHHQGKQIVLATGRHHNNVAEISQDIGIPIYKITSNGSRIHGLNQELLFSADIPQKLISEIVQLLDKDPNIYISIFQGDDWFTNKEDKLLRAQYEQNTFRFQLYDIDQLPSDAMKISIMQVDYTSSDQSLLYKYEAQLNELFGDQVNVTFSSYNYLEVLPLGITKGSSLEKLTAYLEHQMDHCIAFGDDMNDVEMLQSVGKGLIMGTASNRVKENLPDLEIIGHCADQSVARYLKQLLLD